MIVCICVCVSLNVTERGGGTDDEKMSFVAHLLTFVEEAASALDSRPRGRKQMLLRK